MVEKTSSRRPLSDYPGCAKRNRPPAGPIFFQNELMTSKKNVTADLIDFFASVKLALALLIVLALAAVGGTIIPQNLDPHQYVHEYGPRLYTFLNYLDMFDMYHSWWFNGLLALLVVNLVVCSIKRFPRTMKLAAPTAAARITPGFLTKQPFSRQGRRANPLETLTPEIREKMKKLFGRPREIKTDWGALIWAEKGAFSRFGVYLVHFSLLFIVAGALVGNFWGFQAYLNLNEGETAGRVVGRRPAAMIDLPFDLRLERFVVKYYDTGAPSEFRSEVTIIEDGRPVGRAAIRVNHPLTYRGVTFYQSSYGQTLAGTVGLKVASRSDDRTVELQLQPDRPQPLPQDAGTVQIIEFIPNVMNAGPALRLLVRPAQGQPYVDWAFAQRPDFIPPSKGPWLFTLTDHQVRYYTGLQVNRDPGVGLIWAGCGLMLLGFIVTFFFAHQKTFVGLIPDGRQVKVLLAGSTHRHPASFQIKFEKLAEAVLGETPAGDKQT